MSWEVGNYYRGRAVSGEFAIKAIESTGTKYIEGLIEVTLGPQQGERVRYRGYINTTENQKRTADELRAMGARVQRWGDWQGIGGKDCRFRLMADEGEDGRLFYRAAFVQDVPKIDKVKNAVVGDELEALNAEMPPPPPAEGTVKSPF